MVGSWVGIVNASLYFGGSHWVLMLVSILLFVSYRRVPMYSEAKLAFFIYLWYPKTMVCNFLDIGGRLFFDFLLLFQWPSLCLTNDHLESNSVEPYVLILHVWFWQGTTYVYDSFFRPYVAKHESDIDRNLLELRTRAGDFAVMYWQRAATYGQTRVFEILQYVASQSTPLPRPAQVPYVNALLLISTSSDSAKLWSQQFLWSLDLMS